MKIALLHTGRCRIGSAASGSRACEVTESEGVRGLVLTVQSNVVGPPEVEERMNTFLKDFRDVLATCPRRRGADRNAVDKACWRISGSRLLVPFVAEVWETPLDDL